VHQEIPNPFFTEAYKLDDGFDGTKEGWYSKEQFIKDFENFFEQFRSVEAFLPQVSLQKSQ